MSLICTTVTDWVVKKVLEPVTKWVKKVESRCKKLPWPINWFCSVVTRIIKVVVWVAREILVPINRTFCSVMTDIIYHVLSPFAAAIDAICPRCHVGECLKKWLRRTPRITLQDKKRHPTVAGHWIYEFKCHCRSGAKTVTVTANHDDAAAKEARQKCQKECS